MKHPIALLTVLLSSWLCACSTSGEFQIGDPTSNLTDDDGNVWFDPDTKTVNILKSWDYRPSWWFMNDKDGKPTGGLDVSQYNQLVVELLNSDTNVQVMMEDVNGGHASAVGRNMIVVPLAENTKVKQVYLQGVDTGTAYFHAAYFRKMPPSPRENIGLEHFCYTWNDTEAFILLDGAHLEYVSAPWGGLAAWLNNCDWSAYDRLVFEFGSPVEVPVRAIVEYNEGESSSSRCEAGATSCTVMLDKTQRRAVKQAALQPASATHMLITSVYLVKTGQSVEQ